MANPARVFISYSSKDSDLVTQLKRDLTAAGITVWLDHEQLMPDTLDWQDAVRRGIAQATHIIYAASPDAARSQYVIHEITMARGENKPVFAFWIRGADDKWYDSTPMGWILAQYTDGRGASYQAGMARLLTALGMAAAPQQGDADAGSSNQIDWSEFDRRMEGMRASARDIPDLPARLAQLGFRSVNVRGAPAIIPPMVSVAAGSFQMGSDKASDPKASVSETPQHHVVLAAFQIGKYPVTVAEYTLAVRAGSVREPHAAYTEIENFHDYFENLFSRSSDKAASVGTRSYDISWADQLAHPDHPVIGVSWHDALAYITWLRNVTERAEWRLPSEAEWEKAARWDEKRRISHVYPWGDTFSDQRCARIQGNAKKTVPIGSNPGSDSQRSGASSYGAEDMVGNAGQWTSSRYKPYPYVATDGREDPKTPGLRVSRGGSFRGNWQVARAANRFQDPVEQTIVLGFRLARSGS